MHLKQRIASFVALGLQIKGITDGFESGKDDEFENLLWRCSNSNPWFTAENIIRALNGISELTEEEKLKNWLSKYSIPDEIKQQKVGVIMAGNIPLAGFHDLMCILLTGNHCVARLSADDQMLLPWLVSLMTPEIQSLISIERERIPNTNAIIATGSNNSSRYFEYYFKSKPHIIRKNRHSVAVLTGNETEADYAKLSEDIFLYFGLGCRSITKLYVPENWSPESFFTIAQNWKHLMNHSRYSNNYEYQKAVFLVNSQQHWDPGFMLMKEDERIYSPVSVVNYQVYTSIKSVLNELDQAKDQLQCIVCKDNEFVPKSIPLGMAQHPGPEVFADHIDTIDFLLKLNANQV